MFCRLSVTDVSALCFSAAFRHFGTEAACFSFKLILLFLGSRVVFDLQCFQLCISMVKFAVNSFQMFMYGTK